MSDFQNIDFNNLTPAEFEQHLPELFSTSEGKVSEDARLTPFFDKYPDSIALVRDLEAIADMAKGLFEPTQDVEPDDSLWGKIQSQLDKPEEPEPGGLPA